MVYQPLSWKSLDDGGYIDLGMDLVKHWDNRSIRDALRNAKLGRVYRAINALQGTQWRINDFVYEVMKRMRSKQQDFPGWPTKEQITKAEKRWRRLEGEANRGKHNEFAEGKEWAVGGAVSRLTSSWGHGCDKKPFKERRLWVKAHRQEIVNSADEPHFKHALWKEAKKPWRFLAACKEYADFLRKGRNSQSHLPIAMDGTCNGFQHLSAMLRDRPGAEATNLLPDISPKDIYTIVMERLRKRIEDQVKSHGQGKLAKQWRRLGIDRDLVKPGTMTTPYGAKWKTKRDQLTDFLLETKMDTPVLRGDPLKAIELAEYLVSPLDICIKEICKAHSEIEEWLKKVAETLAGRTVYELVAEQMSQTLRRKASGRRDALASRCLESLGGRVTWNIVSDAAITAAAGRRRVLRRFKSASRAEAGRLAGYFIDLVGKSVRSVLDDLPECSRTELAKWLRDGDRKLKALSPRGRPVCWTSPSGFPVVQAKWLYPEERLGSKRLYGEYLYQDKSQPEIGLDRIKQRSGITPNFVHALDAAHMILTVNALRRNKLRDFAVIHDSYAVHACDVDTLNRTLRKTFVDIYRTDVLSTFWEAVKCANRGVPELTTVGPPPRRRGKWPIEAVLRSRYFFS